LTAGFPVIVVLRVVRLPPFSPRTILKIWGTVLNRWGMMSPSQSDWER
jgi:hypothetical protein